MRTATAIVLTVLVLLGSATAETTLHWWQFWTDPDTRPLIDSLAAEFEAQHSGINVEVTDLTWANGHEKIAVAFASGTAPDILELGSDWLAEFADNKLLLPLNTKLGDDTAQFDGFDMSIYKGEIVGMPWILGTRVLYANHDLLRRAGYDSMFVPIKWDDFRLAAYRIDSLGKDIHGWGSNAPEKHRLYKKFLPFLWSAGSGIWSDDGRFCLLGSQASLDAVRFYKELHDSVGYVESQRGIEDAFLAGKIGFVISGDWLLKRIRAEQPSFKVLTSFIPGKTGIGRSFKGGEFLCLNASTGHADEAFEFVRFITSPANQIRFCRASQSANPSSREAQQHEMFQTDPLLLTFVKQLRFANHPPVDPHWVDMENALESALEKVLFEDKLLAHTMYRLRLEIEGIAAR